MYHNYYSLEDVQICPPRPISSGRRFNFTQWYATFRNNFSIFLLKVLFVKCQCNIIFFVFSTLISPFYFRFRSMSSYVIPDRV